MTLVKSLHRTYFNETVLKIPAKKISHHVGVDLSVAGNAEHCLSRIVECRQVKVDRVLYGQQVFEFQ
jgi:hypothetical protein